MGFLTGAIITLAIGAGAAILLKSTVEEKKRKSIPCNFNEKVSEEDFKSIVKNICDSMKRITVFSVEGPIVKATVRSQSGISNWNFVIDFNDYGCISGKYWLTNENTDSQIPLVIAEQIKKEINKKSNK